MHQLFPCPHALDKYDYRTSMTTEQERLQSHSPEEKGNTQDAPTFTLALCLS